MNETESTAEQVEAGPLCIRMEDVWAHFGYTEIGEYHRSWHNTPEQIERLASLPEILRMIGMQNRIKVTFDYDPDYPRLLLQATVISPGEKHP